MGPDLAHTADRIRRNSTKIPIAKDKRGDAPFSVDANLCMRRQKAKCWKIRASKCPTMFIRAPATRRKPPTSRQTITVDFEKGDAVAVDGKKQSPATFAQGAQRSRQAAWRVGRLDLVENRFVGMKSRGM